MARVTYGESITEYVGSIGGVTYLRNASGPIAKLRSNPPVNPSPLQSPNQMYLAKLVAYWPTLSEGYKGQWGTLAAFHKHTTPWGYTKTLSGYQWFMSVNMHSHKYADFIYNYPFTWQTLAPPDQFELIATPTEFYCKWTNTYSPPHSLLIYLTLPLRQSSLKLRRSLFYVGYEEDPLPLSTLDLIDKFETLVGVTWATFYASSNCSIICRLQEINFTKCFTFAFTSAIVKIG